jgi:dihydrofolate synthase/folylpolyglutamate synthase
MSATRSAEILASLEGRGIRLELAPFRRLLAALGEPQLAAPAAIVAGTNGKGSVVALLDAALAAAGYRALAATSPHLVSPHERIRIAGADVSEPTLADALERVLAAATPATHPTYFEALVAATFLAGAEAGVDLLLLEVGLGGRLDATNASEPVVSTVTRIGLDHTAELGSTLAAIAAEKAGVFRAGRAAVVARQPAAADAALARAAAGAGARLRRVESTVTVVAAEFRGLAGHALELATDRARYRFDLALAGAHQVDNAATALAAAEELAGAGFARLDSDAIARGFAAARWPCRLEALAAGDGRATVLLDAAHNPDGCAALAAFLDRLGRPFTLLFGALADKDLDGMLPPLAARAARVVLTRPDSPRAADPAALAARLGKRVAAALVEPDPARALELARAAGPELVVACGSLYLVGRLRARLLADGARAVGG